MPWYNYGVGINAKVSKFVKSPKKTSTLLDDRQEVWEAKQTCKAKCNK